jgi:hypothetical protein
MNTTLSHSFQRECFSLETKLYVISSVISIVISCIYAIRVCSVCCAIQLNFKKHRVQPNLVHQKFLTGPHGIFSEYGCLMEVILTIGALRKAHYSVPVATRNILCPT